ncbi:MAG: DUF3618 domain-containing protein [Sphingomicrobium sp.]
MNDNSSANRPDEIEREVRRTQDQIGDTVDKLEEKLNPRDISRSVIGDDGTDLAEEALEVTRTNPIPVALIVVGVIWLLASSSSPAIRRVTDRITGKSGTDSRGLRPRSAEPAPIGPPPETGQAFDRRRSETAGS